MIELPYNNVEYTQSSKPNYSLYSQNLDFSTFPLLCDIVYRELKCLVPEVIKLLPFCAFLHSMTTCLNAWLFHTVTYINGEKRFCHEEDAISLIPKDMLIPRPIAEYFSMINTVVAPSGDVICVNIPTCCLPQTTVRDKDSVMAEIPPGSFGSATADSHNAYECYVAPYVTRQLFEATRNGATEYMPLPKGHFPADTYPNQNLLGYFVPERLTLEGLDLLHKYQFPNTNDMAGRLQCVQDLMVDVSYLLFHCCRHFDMVQFYKIKRYPGQSSLVFAQLDTDLPDQRGKVYIIPIANTLHSPYAFGATTAAQATLFALRRQRSHLTQSLCYTTADGSAPDGWSDTINDNFTMTGLFAPEFGHGHPHSRDSHHYMLMSFGDRRYIINKWVKTFKKSQ